MIEGASSNVVDDILNVIVGMEEQNVVAHSTFKLINCACEAIVTEFGI